MGEKRKKSLDTANLKEPRSKIWTKNSYGKWLCLCGTFYKYFLDGQPAFLELFIHDFCFTGNTATENHIMSVAIALQSSLTLITPAVVPKRHTLFAMIFWNNCVCLNICPAVLNVEHFERRWVWLSFNNTFYKDGRPQAPTIKCAPMFVSSLHTQGPGSLKGFTAAWTSFCWRANWGGLW